MLKGLTVRWFLDRAAYWRDWGLPKRHGRRVYFDLGPCELSWDARL